MHNRLVLAKVLRKWRKAFGWTQEQTTEAICRYSSKPLDLKTYQRWERGETQPHVKNYSALQLMVQEHSLWPTDFERSIDHDLEMMKLLLILQKFTKGCLREITDDDSKSGGFTFFSIKEETSPLEIWVRPKQHNGNIYWHICKFYRHTNGECFTIWQRTTTATGG